MEGNNIIDLKFDSLILQKNVAIEQLQLPILDIVTKKRKFSQLQYLFHI